MNDTDHRASRSQILIECQADYVNWLIFNKAGELEQSVLEGDLKDLALWVKDATDIHVIIPAQDVLLTSAELPRLNKQRLQQALPFAIEEKLISDINELHFAVGAYQANPANPEKAESGQWSVAVIAKEKLEFWLSYLKQADIIPTAIIPASLALPFTPQEWHVSMNPHTHIHTVRTGEYAGFACDADNFDTLLKLAPQSPQHVHYYSSEKEIVEQARKSIQAHSFINLLQGDYQNRHNNLLAKKTGRILCYLTLAWLGLIFLNNLGAFFILKNANHQTEKAIEKIYYATFPQAKSVIAPRERMEEKLKKISTQGNNQYFLGLLAIAGDALNKNKSIQMKSFEFRDNQLKLALSAPRFETLDAFTQALTHLGSRVRVKQQNAEIAGTMVKANVLIYQE